MPSSFTDQEVQTLIDAAANLIDTVYSAGGPRLLEDSRAVQDALHKLTHCNVRAICGECDVTNPNNVSAQSLFFDNEQCSFCYDTLSHREECNKVHPPLRAS